MLPAVRLAYADPPYPGKAHLYPENTEVDHIELIGRLSSYDGWALSTDETNLRYVLALCPSRTRVLAWCRNNAPPFGGVPYQAWEPVLCKPARVTGVPRMPSYFVGAAPTGRAQVDGLTGQKTSEFCDWLIRCLGASPDDTLDDLYPGTGIMGQTFDRFGRQLTINVDLPPGKRSHAARANMLRRVAEPIPGIDAPNYSKERLAS